MTALILITIFFVALWKVRQWEKQSKVEAKKELPYDENSYS